jgi:hypothetical protein
MNKTKSVVTITLGDMAENHVGMEQIGQMVGPGQGFNLADLKTAKQNFEALGLQCILYDLSTLGNGEEEEEDDHEFPPAYVLVVSQAIQKLLATHSPNQNPFYNYDGMFEELVGLPVDKKAFMYGRVVNKHARWNLCFSNQSSEPDYPNGKGRIVSWDSVPITKTIYGSIGTYCGPKAEGLQGEANYYYDKTKTGIGYHGDSERRKVIGLRLGADLPLYYQWYKQGNPVGKKIKVKLSGGDIYMMSEKAVGTDWKKKTIYTLRHATGSSKYTEV